MSWDHSPWTTAKPQPQPQPLLTDAERAAIEEAADFIADDGCNEECARIAETLYALLERTK